MRRIVVEHHDRGLRAVCVQGVVRVVDTDADRVLYAGTVREAERVQSVLDQLLQLYPG